jgi:ABC-type phosphate/phosphonate transport system substrate-binding protein
MSAAGSSMLVANARMYSVEATSAAAWQALLAWVAQRADVPMAYEPHAPPASLPALWRRPDLGCALMCGYPFATWHDTAVVRPHLLGAVVPRNSDGAEPRYRTAIVVRADSDIQEAGELRGRRFAYTTPDSQSGYQAARRWLAERAMSADGRWFAATVGPLVTPRAVVDALVRGDADAGPLDSYWLDLLTLHEPDTARQLRTVALTAWTPLPPFVCSAAVPPPLRQRIAGALLAASDAPDLADVRATLALAAIAPVEADDYAVLADYARATSALGYPVLQ